MKYVIGVDIGTGSVKAVAVNLQGEPLEASRQHYSFTAPMPGFNEQDPEHIWNAFKLSLNDLLIKMTIPPSAIGLSSAMHSLIAVDKDCQPLAPMMTWADSRSAEIARNLKGTENGLKIYKATGTPIHAMSPLCKLIWLREYDTVLFHKTHKFISIKEYIWYKLFGEFKTDHSLASGTGLFNIYDLAWNKDSLTLAGINDKQLSEPVPTDYFRTYTPPLNNPGLPFLPSDIPFVIGASDGCMANLGSMANAPGMAAITIGTSGAVRIASSKPLPDEKSMTFSYILDRETYICGGPINNGGIALQWWLKNIAQSKVKEEDYGVAFEQIATIPAGCNGLFFLPYLTGERAPVWDSESCGLFFGVKLAHTQSHFSRAVVEGICFAIKDVLNAVEENSAPVSYIHISGGLVKSERWMQILADITGKNLVVVQTEDASAIGAALMAMKSTGLSVKYPVYELEGLKIINPDEENTKIYTTSFNIYKQLYPVLKETMHQLNQSNN